jgi:hypothetical protein
MVPIFCPPLLRYSFCPFFTSSLVKTVCPAAVFTVPGIGGFSLWIMYPPKRSTPNVMASMKRRRARTFGLFMNDPPAASFAACFF